MIFYWFRSWFGRSETAFAGWYGLPESFSRGKVVGALSLFFLGRVFILLFYVCAGVWVFSAHIVLLLLHATSSPLSAAPFRNKRAFNADCSTLGSPCGKRHALDFSSILPSCIGLTGPLSIFNRLLPCFTALYRILLGVVLFCWGLLGFTGFGWISSRFFLSLTGFLTENRIRVLITDGWTRNPWQIGWG